MQVTVKHRDTWNVRKKICANISTLISRMLLEYFTIGIMKLNCREACYMCYSYDACRKGRSAASAPPTTSLMSPSSDTDITAPPSLPYPSPSVYPPPKLVSLPRTARHRRPRLPNLTAGPGVGPPLLGSLALSSSPPPATALGCEWPTAGRARINNTDSRNGKMERGDQDFNILLATDSYKVGSAEQRRR